jgi:hypothetical protein
VYFWRIEALKRRLIAAPLNDREALPYLVAYGALMSVVIAFPPAFPNGWDTLQGLIGMLASIVGTIWVYRRNGGQTGSEMLQRYFALSWVLTLRFLPLMAVLFMSAALTIPGFDIERTGPAAVAMNLGVIVLFYQRLGAHVRQVSQAVANAPGPAREHEAPR